MVVVLTESDFVAGSERALAAKGSGSYIFQLFETVKVSFDA